MILWVWSSDVKERERGGGRLGTSPYTATCACLEFIQIKLERRNSKINYMKLQRFTHTLRFSYVAKNIKSALLYKCYKDECLYTEWRTKNRPAVSQNNVGVGLGLCTGDSTNANGKYSLVREGAENDLLVRQRTFVHWRTRRSFSAPSLTIEYFPFAFVESPVQSPRPTPTLFCETAGRFFVRHPV